MQNIRTAFDADKNAAEREHAAEVNRRNLARSAAVTLAEAGLPPRCSRLWNAGDGITFEWTLWICHGRCGNGYGHVSVTFHPRKRAVWQWRADKHDDAPIVADIAATARRSNDPPADLVEFVRAYRELLFDPDEQCERAERRAKVGRRGP